ncbi:ArsR/SmtB family transcription factor [Paenibacillus ihumii]|uniref:ArsR/SmtB family transcription factor n=1 Tax=Paenibacillus ihumii TaxID=687436 RepID=UPI0006D7EBA1|nr:metalloregulator ArsR/SmtB family transcription factor [Paenibacillus ihumii]
MEKPVKTINKYDSACPEEEANLQSLRTSLIDQETSSEMANWFKTFSDPTRLRIMDALLQKELCVQDLTVLLDMGQSAISHQLRTLRNMRIVKRRKEGKTVFYSLDDEHIEQIFLQTLQHIKHS